MKSFKDNLRRWSRTIHRELSFFLSGMVLIYAISGLVMNHRDTINPHYSISRTELTLNEIPAQDNISRQSIEAIMQQIGVSEQYTKHYFTRENELKVFLKGGSSLVIDLASGKTIYESLRRRPLLSPMARLHYNPGRWWTWFADFFAIGLIVITLTGVIMLKGKRGLWGRGGLELLAGILIPILFLLLS